MNKYWELFQLQHPSQRKISIPNDFMSRLEEYAHTFRWSVWNTQFSFLKNISLLRKTYANVFSSRKVFRKNNTPVSSMNVLKQSAFFFASVKAAVLNSATDLFSFFPGISRSS